MSSTVTYKGSTIASVSNTTKTLETAGKYMEDDVTIVDVSQATPVLQTVSKSYTPTETAQSEDVTAGSGYDGLEKVSVSVGAISSSYVGSGITRRSSTDLSASGGTVTAPAGYYSSSASKAVASGSATAPASISGTSAAVSTSGTSTLTLSKTVSVTPSVSAGYVSSGTAGNSSVSLSASVNIRSSSSLSASGDTVTAPAGYYASSASKAVAAGTAGTPTATKGTVSNHSVSVTPSVTNTTGYITGSTKTGTAVTVTASELASGNKAITSNGTGIDVVGYSTVSVDVAGGGSGSVYQDAEGYLVLSDEPGTHVEIDELDVTENGTYTAPTGHAYDPVVVNVSGGGGVEEKQISFFDYDGTILYSYTADEIEDMTEETDLPPNPTHDGLTSQGWNWTLAQIKDQLTDIPDGIIEVGQSYLTESTGTEIDITLDDPNYLSPYLAMCVNKSATVDWGDGSQVEEITGTSDTTLIYTQHVYPAVGDYTITVKRKPYDGTNHFYSFRTGGTDKPAILAASPNTNSFLYSGCIKHIRLGYGLASSSYSSYFGPYSLCNCVGLETVTIPNGYLGPDLYAFYGCKSLSFVVIGKGSYMGEYCFAKTGLKRVSRPGGNIRTFGGHPFQNCYNLERFTFRAGDSAQWSGGHANQASYFFTNCYSLKHVEMPSDAQIMGYNSFYYCESLEDITISDTETSIGTNAFYFCTALRKPITIPGNVSYINEGAFSHCYSVLEIHLLGTTPPTLYNTNAFTSLSADAVIYVPYSADHSVLNAYQTASNWSSFASYMQEEPQ